MSRVFPREVPASFTATMERLKANKSPSVRLSGAMSGLIYTALLEAAVRFEDAAPEGETEDETWCRVIDELIRAAGAAFGAVLFVKADHSRADELASEVGECFTDFLQEYGRLLRAATPPTTKVN